MKKATKARNKEKPVNSSEFTKPLENVKVIKVEEIEDLTTLSVGIDDYIQKQLNRDWLGEIS